MSDTPLNSTASPDSNWAKELYRLTVTENPYIPVEAHPRQFVFLTYPAREILYGGAAGGGKSVALLAAALQYIQVPGYAALLLRRTLQDLKLPEALIPLSHQWLAGADCEWNGNSHVWRFPNGSTLSFGYLENENDKYRYQGAAFQFIGLDELTQFSPTQYAYLFSRLRKKGGVPVPLRMRAASNPGGYGHDWVRARFVDPKTCERRVFVSARLEDNPSLDREAYEESLQALDPITRKQLRHGDWNVRADAGVFKQDWFRYWQPSSDGKRYLLGTQRREVAAGECSRFLVADIAGTEKRAGNDPDYTVAQVWDLSPTGDMILVHQWRGQFEIPDVEDRLVTVAREHGVDYMLVEKNGIGLGVVQTVRRRGLAVRPIVAKGTKVVRSQTAQIRFEAGSIYFPAGAPFVPDLESELLTFPTEGAHDDQADCISHAARHAQQLAGPVRNKVDDDHEALLAMAEQAAEAERLSQPFARDELGRPREVEAAPAEERFESMWMSFDGDDD